MKVWGIDDSPENSEFPSAPPTRDPSKEWSEQQAPAGAKDSHCCPKQDRVVHAAGEYTGLLTMGIDPVG